MNSKQPKRRCCGRIDLGEPLRDFGTCLALGLDSSTVQGMPAVSASRIALPSRSNSSPVRKRSRRLSLNLSIPRAGLVPSGNDARAARKGVHAADHRQHAIGLKGRIGERGMQPADLEPGQLVGLGGAYRGLHDAVQNVPVELRRPGLALGSHVLGHEPVCQFGHRGRAAFGGLLVRWIVPVRHRSQDDLGARSGALRRDFPDRRDGVAPHGAPRPAPAL